MHKVFRATADTQRLFCVNSHPPSRYFASRPASVLGSFSSRWYALRSSVAISNQGLRNPDIVKISMPWDLLAVIVSPLLGYASKMHVMVTLFHRAFNIRELAYWELTSTALRTQLSSRRRRCSQSGLLIFSSPRPRHQPPDS